MVAIEPRNWREQLLLPCWLRYSNRLFRSDIGAAFVDPKLYREPSPKAARRQEAISLRVKVRIMISFFPGLQPIWAKIGNSWSSQNEKAVIRPVIIAAPMTTMIPPEAT